MGLNRLPKRQPCRMSHDGICIQTLNLAAWTPGLGSILDQSAPPRSPLLTCASRLGGPCLPLTRAASMLCDWPSSSVARLVENSMPPTFMFTRLGHSLGGARIAWPMLVEGSSCGGGGPAAASEAARRGTWRGGLLLLPLPACCPWAAALGGSSLVLCLAVVGRATQL